MSQTGNMAPSAVASGVSSAICRFCAIFQKEADLPGVYTPWLANGDYAALVSVGALVPGWTLLCPVAHHTNMQASYAAPNFWEFASLVESVVSNRYGQVSVFEHGPNVPESLTGCGTGHAHMHLVPVDFSLTVESIRFDRTKSWTSCFASEIAARVDGREYLFVADKFEGTSTRGMLCVLEESTSQFFRKVIAQRLGMAEFSDYRRYPMLDIVEASSLQLATDVAERNVAMAPPISF